MKRDMDLIRKILLAMEAHEHGQNNERLKIDGFSSEQIGFHAYLLMEAGLIHGADVTHNGSESPEAIPTSLTWEGYEFLEAARDDTLWSRAKGAGSAAMSVLKPILIALAIETAKKKTGLTQ